MSPQTLRGDAMDTPELFDLVDKATGQLYRLALQYASKHHPRHASVALGNLAAELYMLNNELAHLNTAAGRQTTHRLDTLMEDLARLCTWQRSSDPSLRASRIKNVACGRDLDSTKHALLAFASDSLQAREAMLDSFRRFTTLPGHDDISNATEVIPRHDRKDSDDNYASHVNKTLYDLLRNHLRCNCEPSTSWPHVGGVRLRKQVQIEDGHVYFDAVFSRATNPSTLWQPFRFEIPGRTAHRRVMFHNESTPPEGLICDDGPRLIRSLCEVFRFEEEVGPATYRLKVQGEGLVVLPDTHAGDQDIGQSPSMSLAELTDNTELSSLDKITLSCIIARSVWQYYDSNWMAVKWIADRIHFLPEAVQDSSQARNLFRPANPYIVVDENTFRQNSSREFLGRFGLAHRFPRILALGVILIQIFQGTFTEMHEDEDTQAINKDLLMGRRVLSSKQWPALGFVNNQINQTLRHAIEACFDSKLADSRLGQYGAEQRRTFLYQKVVCPLTDLLATVDSLPDRPSETVPSGVLGVLTDTAVTDRPHSESWLKGIRESSLNRDLHAALKAQPGMQRVRIAVLDTGYDKDSAFFEILERRKRIKGWKDWANGTVEAKDEDGHGSHVLSLVMKIAPTADVYVARVAVNSQDLYTASKQVADAIDWATDTAQWNVDIITMSFGFEGEVLVRHEPKISNAISRALANRDQRILFLAAASNSGGNRKEMFPATHESVISIRATDHLGAYLSINPPPDFTGPDVFATLGKAVPSAWLNAHPGEKCSTGTSVSTPIAAGFAALFLEAARVGLAQRMHAKRSSSLEIDELHCQRLHTREGMQAAFKKASTTMTERCRYLHPRQFLQCSEQDRWEWIMSLKHDLNL